MWRGVFDRQPSKPVLKPAPLTARQNSVKKTQQLLYSARSQSHKLRQSFTFQQRYFAIVVKSILSARLKQYFQKIRERVVIKKIPLSLIVLRVRRNVENCFKDIQNYSNTKYLHSLERHYNRSRDGKLIEIVINKINAKRKQQGFQQIKKYDHRQRSLVKIAQILHTVTNRVTKMQYMLPCFSSIKSHFSNFLFKRKSLAFIINLDKRRIIRIKMHAFNKILIYDQTMLWEYDQLTKKEKIQQLNTLTNMNKHDLHEERQRIKSIKAQIDQEKLQKNSVLNEKRKIANSSRTVIVENKSKFTKQKLALQNQLQKLSANLSQLTRKAQSRKLKQKMSYDSFNKCMLAYRRIISEQKEDIRSMSKLIPSIQDEIDEFKKSEQHLLRQNLKLQHQIYVYQKVGTSYRGSPEYYQLEHENRVLRQTMRCIILREYDNFVKGRIVRPSDSKAVIQDEQPTIMQSLLALE